MLLKIINSAIIKFQKNYLLNSPSMFSYTQTSIWRNFPKKSQNNSLLLSLFHFKKIYLHTCTTKQNIQHKWCTDPGFHQQSTGLLQFAVLRHTRWFNEPTAVSSEWRHTSHHQVRRCEHITPALRQLHWLPVCRRVDFKISTLVYRSLAGTAPVYLADECMVVTAAGRRPLWSADNQTCLVKRSRNQFGDRCFATAGPTLRNSLPEQLQQPDITFGHFKLSLKTFMFG